MSRATRAAWATHRAKGAPEAAKPPADIGSPLIDADVPWETRRRVYQAILMAVRGQGILKGETLPALMTRVRPNALTGFALEGLRVNLDLPGNTHEALCAGEVVAEIRRVHA